MKRFISFALVFLLAAGLMTGCRGGNQDESTGGATQPTSATSPSSAGTTPTQGSMPDMTDILPDYDGDMDGTDSGPSQGVVPDQGDLGRGRSLTRY